MHIIARYVLYLSRSGKQADPSPKLGTTCVTKLHQTCDMRSITVRMSLLWSRLQHSWTPHYRIDDLLTVSHALSIVRKDSFASLCLTIAKYCDQSDHVLALQDVLDLAWPKRMSFVLLHTCLQARTHVSSSTVLQSILHCLRQQAWFLSCVTDPASNQSGQEVTIEEQCEATRLLQGIVLLDERARNTALQHSIVPVGRLEVVNIRACFFGGGCWFPCCFARHDCGLPGGTGHCVPFLAACQCSYYITTYVAIIIKSQTVHRYWWSVLGRAPLPTAWTHWQCFWHLDRVQLGIFCGQDALPVY